MQITTLSEVAFRRRRIALGVFDGVHVGHQEVIRGCDTVLTFDPHPRRVVGGAQAPALLSDRMEKLRRLAALGVSEVVLIRFDRDFAAQPAQVFVDQVLVGRVGAKGLSVGENFTFGAGAAGNSAMLGADPRFRTRVVPTLTAEGQIVSSTRIRALVADGLVTQAAALLGRPLTHPARLGHVCVTSDPASQVRLLDFDRSLALPGPGSYACLVDGLAAVVRVGARASRLMVAHPLDFPSTSPSSGVVEVQFLQPLGSGTPLEPALADERRW